MSLPYFSPRSVVIGDQLRFHGPGCIILLCAEFHNIARKPIISCFWEEASIGSTHWDSPWLPFGNHINASWRPSLPSVTGTPGFHYRIVSILAAAWIGFPFSWIRCIDRSSHPYSRRFMYASRASNPSTLFIGEPIVARSAGRSVVSEWSFDRPRITQYLHCRYALNKCVPCKFSIVRVSSEWIN